MNTVYWLRVASIVLRSIFPVVAAFIVLRIDGTITDMLLYLCFAIAILGVMVFLAMEYNELPSTFVGMLLFIASPFLSLAVYQLAMRQSWKEGSVFMTAQTLLTVIFMAKRVYQGKKDPMGPFLIGIAAANIVAIAVMLVYLYDFAILFSMDGLIAWAPIIIAIVTSVIEAHKKIPKT